MTAAESATGRAVEGNSAPEPARRRSWYRTIGGKLLIAFGLIAALTVGATFLSLTRFDQIDSVLRSLVDVNMPALKLSMEVQSRAADVIEAAIEVGRAEDEVERFDGMATATERISTLWQTVEKLRSVIVDDGTMAPIQTLIARIDSQVGNLDRAVGEGLAASTAPVRTFRQLQDATTAANRTITSILDRLNTTHGRPADRSTSESPGGNSWSLRRASDRFRSSGRSC